jgi:DNA anti-recombination protein RmuC
MEYNKFSNEINEKIATVFQQYAINPIKTDIDNSFDKFEKKLFSDESLFADLSDDVCNINRNVSTVNNAVKDLQESVDFLEKSVQNSINNTADSFSQTAFENQKNILSRIDTVSTEVFEKVEKENAFLKKIIFILMAISGTSLVGTVALIVLSLLG